MFYYSAGVQDLDSIQPIPEGLRMIAGSAATMPGMTQDTGIVRWHCQTWESDDATNPRFSATIPYCEAPDRVRMDVFFPSCWDGVNLDSADHKSHMAYPTASGTCPATHPVPVVRVSYHYAFGVLPGGLSLHADWFNGWHPAVMDTILENCIQKGLDCHDGNLANGYRLSGTRTGSGVEPAIVNGGLGY